MSPATSVVTTRISELLADDVNPLHERPLVAGPPARGCLVRVAVVLAEREQLPADGRADEDGQHPRNVLHYNLSTFEPHAAAKSGRRPPRSHFVLADFGASLLAVARTFGDRQRLRALHGQRLRSLQELGSSAWRVPPSAAPRRSSGVPQNGGPYPLRMVGR